MKSRLFGTDGIRGPANKYPITAEMAMRFGMAAGHLFTKDAYRHRVLIAKDTRLSCYLIEAALTSGFISVGIDVILVGPLPTSGVPMLISALRADMGVMISASHNLYHDNGLKLFDKNGLKLSDKHENSLQDLMLGGNLDKLLVASDKLGRAKRLDDAHGRYIENVKRSFPKDLSLAGMKIVVDCANGAAYQVAPTIFWELGAEVITLGCEPDGININLDCGSTKPEMIARKVLETQADLGIALDGDADRVVICDDKGAIIAGDHLIGMIAANMKNCGTLRGNGIVITQMSNKALDRYLASLGLDVFRSQVGDRYVSKLMRERKCNLGGEQSGHIIIDDYSTTGDGIVASLQALATLAKSGNRISEISRPFTLYPQLTRNISYQEANPLENPKLQDSLAKLQKQHHDIRVLVRKSGTEKLVRITVEASCPSKTASIADEIEELVLGSIYS